MPVTVTIDDYLPHSRWKELSYGKVSNDNAVFFPLLEKAVAKYHGNYEAINGGMEYHAFAILMGVPAELIETAAVTTSSLWETLSTEDAKGSMITVGSFIIEGGNDQM